MTRRLTIFLAAVFFLRLIVALQLDRHPLLQPDAGLDTTAYVELAKRVAAGDLALGPGLYYVSPLYIYFLALIYAATESFTAARLVQAALGTAAVALIFLTAETWFGRRAAWIAATLAGFCGVFIYYEALILQSSIDVFLTALALWLLTRSPLFAGLTLGVASLNRPNMLIAAIAIIGVLMVVRRVKPAALILVGVLAGLAPVTIRNVVVAERFALVSSHGGINFYIGNAEGATGFFHAIPGMRSTVAGLAVGESSDYSRRAWEWIREHPVDWLRLLVWKTYATLNTAHISTPFSYTFYAYDAGTLLKVLVIGPWLIVPLGLFGLIRRRSPIELVTFAIAYAASIIVFFVTERYKLPLFVALVIASGAGVEALIADLKARRLAMLALFALLFGAANWPLRLDDGRGEERMHMAEAMLARENFVEAERWARLSMATPRNAFTARAEYALGRALLGAGRPAEAVTQLQNAIQRGLDVPLAGYDLAVALQQTGDLPAAARALRAVKPPPDADVTVWLQLARRAAEINAPLVAERFLERAVSIAPDHPAAHQMRAINFLVLGRVEDAAAGFERTIALQPQNADALAMLALCEQRLGRIEEARKHAEAAMEIAPRHPIALQVLAGFESR